MEKVFDILLANGLSGVVIAGLGYLLWKILKPLFDQYMLTIKKVGDTQEAITQMVEQLTSRLEKIPASSEQLEDAKNEIISEIKALKNND